ncbi:MAG TPA: Asp-tRNA(Asn)/Glu-tRNA(Gln) amidotransferase subunit GatB [Candidatus Eisenbacteria bacterium]|nr:Asp-tRNA(Asn)/Glu-tRNA(Gln) amidotransferase subunit GatB [Candidatus Eisenbacteria bacterium]
MAREAVIGLECHVQLRTRTKMFCACPVEYGAAANANVCPVCLGLPGALPVVNDAAIEYALRLGLALGCEVHGESEFARKNYFYPDMPKNYQISQYDRPLCTGGALPVVMDGAERRFALTRIHCEEDTGKSFHPERHGDRRVSRVDFDRAGVPLLELVTEPVLRTPAECAAFLLALRRLVRWLGISDGDMEKGQLRCDANVSLRPAGGTTLGTKTEIKNLNSIKGVEKGVTAEIARQARELDTGGRIEQATLLYDADHDRLAVMRSKEHAHDYRYFPEPDLPPLRVPAERLAAARAALPELPWAREERFLAAYGLPAYDAAVVSDPRELADYFEACAAGGDAKLTSNWLMTEVLRALKERGASLEAWATQVPPERLSAFLARVGDRSLPGPLAKQVFAWMADEPGSVDELLARHGVRVQGSAADLAPLVRAVLAENPGAVEQYLGGKTATLGFLVGQVMKRSGGQAVPQAVQELLRRELAGRSGS